MFYNDVPETDEQKARRTMEGFGMAKEFDDWLAGGGARTPTATPNYAPATPMPAGSGMGFSMPQQSLLSPQQSSDVGFAMKPVREQAAEMIGRMGGRDQTAEFNAWMDRPKTGAAEDIRRLAGDGAAGRFLNQPKEYYGMGSTLPTSYSGGADGESGYTTGADYGEATPVRPSPFGSGLPGWSSAPATPYKPLIQDFPSQALGGWNVAGNKPTPPPVDPNVYQHYSATANPMAAPNVATQSQRMDDAYQMMGPPAPPAAQPPITQDMARLTGGGDYVSTFNPNFRSDPFMAKDSFMDSGPIQTLGVNGFRTGSSSPAFDNSGMLQRAGADRYNSQLAHILGQQETSRASNANDLMRTLLTVDERKNAASEHEFNRFSQMIEKVPEGQRTPIIEDAIRRRTLGKEVGDSMLMNEMLSRAKGMAKTKDGVVDTKKMFQSLQAEFDPNKMNKADLIKRIRMMGYTADDVYNLASDPEVGQFAKSLLDPRNPANDPANSNKPWDFFKNRGW